MNREPGITPSRSRCSSDRMSINRAPAPACARALSGVSLCRPARASARSCSAVRRDRPRYDLLIELLPPSAIPLEIRRRTLAEPHPPAPCLGIGRLYAARRLTFCASRRTIHAPPNCPPTTAVTRSRSATTRRMQGARPRRSAVTTQRATYSGPYARSESMKVLDGLTAVAPGDTVSVAELGLPVAGGHGLLLVFWKST